AHGARVITIPMNVGYGAALRRGIEAAAHSRIVIADGDASYPLEYTGEMLRRLEQFDLVIGRRTGTTYYRSLLSYPFRLLYFLLYNPIQLFIRLAAVSPLAGIGLVFAALLAADRAALLVSGTLCVLFGGVFLCFGFLADLVANLRRRVSAGPDGTRR